MPSLGIDADEGAKEAIEADLTAGALCDVWFLDATAAKGDLGLAHKGETADWDEVAKTGVQHFKMVLPEDGSEYKWATDPELKEVQKLNLFDYSKKFVMGDKNMADETAKAEKEYFLSENEHLHGADLMLFCVGGSAFVDVRHYPAGPEAWVRVHLQAGDMLLVSEGCYHRCVMEAGDAAEASIVVLTTKPPNTAKVQTPAAVQQWSKANRGEEHPSRARYHYLFVRPKPRWPFSLLEPSPDINYNYVVVEQMVMCGIGVLLVVLSHVFPDEMTGYWLIMCPFPFMLVWSLLIRQKYLAMQAILNKGMNDSSDAKKLR